MSRILREQRSKLCYNLKITIKTNSIVNQKKPKSQIDKSYNQKRKNKKTQIYQSTITHNNAMTL